MLGWILILAACSEAGTLAMPKPDQLHDGIATSNLHAVGIDASLIGDMADSIASNAYPNIHSVLIFRNGYLVYENYWPGADENRRTGYKGPTQHHRDSLHDVRSISKSITGAAVLLAHHKGRIASLDQRIFDFFPAYKHYAEGGKADITIRHLLTMTSGLSWQESQNDSLKVKNVSHALDFILRQPLASAPGRKFRYNSASSQLLAQIVEVATGQDIDIYTRTHLFQPLGITDYDWTREANGIRCAWAGLRMRTRDLLKFGILYLNDGVWNGYNLLPGDLIEESMRTQVVTDSPNGYGYQFWTLEDSLGNRRVRTVEASGNGGQKIEVNRSENLIVVITAGNYDSTPIANTSYDLYLDFVLPAILD